jgi:hypothetical protein
MCDYSLHHVASRPARVGEILVSAAFSSTYTRGFVAPAEPNVAVCLLPGTEIAFEKDVRRDEFLLFRRSLREKVARFRQVRLEMPHTHHDALEFPSGRVVLLTELTPGQKAIVLQLPAAGPRPDDTAEEGRVAQRSSATEAVGGGGA